MAKWTVQHLKDWHSSPGLSRQVSSKQTPKPNHYTDLKQTFIAQLLKQCRLLSQLIASSWLEGDKATKIREIFTEATGKDDSQLRALLTGKKPELWKQPIFDENEITMYRFQITWNAFEGTLLEHPQALVEQKPPYFTVILPYPPRPELSEFTVTYQQLETWVGAKLEEDENGLVKNPFPPYPYIPLTSC